MAFFWNGLFPLISFVIGIQLIRMVVVVRTISPTVGIQLVGMVIQLALRVGVPIDVF